MQILQNNSQNYLIRKIIAAELKVLKLARNMSDVFETHVENIEKLLAIF